MKTGAAKIDITPPVGCQLSGFLGREQPSVDVLHRLYARALLVEAAGERVLWLHADLIGFTRDFVAAVKANIQQRYGLTPCQVIMSATHGHAGPATIPLLQAGGYDPPYVDWLKGRLMTVAAEAISAVEESQLVFGQSLCDLAHDRRGGPDAHTDPHVSAWGWKRGDGTFIAVLANYGVHPVALGFVRQISGDIHGVAAAHAEEQLPGAPCVLLTNGACGNINPPAYTSLLVSALVAHTQQCGTELGKCILSALDHADGQQATNGGLETRCIDVPIRFQPWNRSQVEQYASDLCDKNTFTSTDITSRFRLAAESWRDGLVAAIEQGKRPDELPMAVHAVRLADRWLVGMGGEIFSRMSDELRALVGRPLCIVGYADGNFGYLPTAAAFGEGGYETDLAFIFYNTLRPRPEAFAEVRDATAALLTR